MVFSVGLRFVQMPYGFCSFFSFVYFNSLYFRPGEISTKYLLTYQYLYLYYIVTKCTDKCIHLIIVDVRTVRTANKRTTERKYKPRRKDWRDLSNVKGLPLSSTWLSDSKQLRIVRSYQRLNGFSHFVLWHRSILNGYWGFVLLNIVLIYWKLIMI